MRQIYFSVVLTVLALILSGANGLMAQQQMTFDNSWGADGYSVISTKANSTTINYSVSEITITDLEVGDATMKEISLPGEFLPNNQGAPNLPGSGRYLALPQGAQATVNIISSRKEVIQNIEIAPSPEIPWDNENKPLVYEKDQSIYSADALYPANPVKISEKTTIRGIDAVVVGVTPFQYNPVTKELTIYTDIQFEVTVDGGNGQFGDPQFRSRFWDPILSDMMLNYSELPKIDYSKRAGNAKDVTGCEYLIVSPNGDDFTAWADSIRRFRNKQGIFTKVVTLEEIGTNSASGLEDYFNDAYNNWDIKPAAVLLLGDYGSNASTQITSPTWDNYCVSDNIYADVTNNDMPDMVFARITARDADELELMIMKFINYETNPPVSEDFYNHPITALGWQTERWFQICSESVGGFWKNELGKDPVRINAVYGGNPNNDPWSTATNTYTVLNVFGPNGLGYIPATPSELGGWTGGTSTMVTNAINDGAFMLQHRDHGYEEGWGEPSYSNNNINSLTNTDLTFVFSINCLTGKYNIGGECFAEKFHRHGYGALGLIAASEVSYSFVNDTYVWGLYDNMWPDFLPQYGATPEPRGVLPAFGNAAGKYFLQQSGWPYNTNNKEVTYNLFHHHGDAFMTVYTQVPQDLTVNHNPVLLSGLEEFEVTADEGALICLSHDGEILGTAIGTGEPVMVEIEAQLPGIFVDLVITKQDFYRYEQAIQVIPPAGAYILKDSFVANDENGNGQIDYSENVSLDVTMKNVGSDDGNNIIVELMTTDEYVTITNGTADFGTIPAESSVTLENAFSFEVGDNVPDQHQIAFTLHSSDGAEEWESDIMVVANAPVLSIGRADFLDATGNGNGMLDPGETGDLIVYIPNDGHSISPEAIAEIASSSQYLTINSSTFEVGTINFEEEQTATFNISVDASTPIAEYIDIEFTLNSGEYGFTGNISKPVGLLVEDWESGDFGTFDWQFMGNADWSISTDEPYEGMYSAKSGEIGDANNTRMILNANVMSDDTISFYFKTSTEENRDFLRFYVDTDIKGIWSGDNDWTRVAYFVEAGEHMFTWIYQKNGSLAGGADAAWVDWIVLPPLMVTSASAGADIDICGAQPVQLNGVATNYESLEWITSGDGTFDDATILNPVYTPGTQDIEDGEVQLTLIAHGPAEDKSDNMMITISTPPTVMLGDDMAGCGDSELTIEEVTAENYASLLWTTSGDGAFADATVMNPVYTPGAADLAAGTVTLTLTTEAMGSCEDASDDIVYTIHEIPSATISGDEMICDGTTATLSVDFTGMAPWTFMIENDYTIQADETPYILELNPAETTTYAIISLSDGNGCQNEEVTTSHTVEVVDGVSVSLINDTTICHNHIITIDAGIDNVNYEWSTGETTKTIDVDITGVEIGDTKSIGLTVSNEFGCTADDEVNVTFKDCTGIGELAKDVMMSVYPNPNNGQFTLSLQSDETQTVNIVMVNILGEVMEESGEITFKDTYSRTFDLENMSAGVYFIRVNSDNGVLIQRLVIE